MLGGILEKYIDTCGERASTVAPKQAQVAFEGRLLREVLWQERRRRQYKELGDLSLGLCNNKSR